VKFVADENVSGAVINRLRSEGHEVWSASEHMAGAADPFVLQTSVRLGALLLTEDKDFGELVYRLGAESGGVLLIRLRGLTPARKAAAVAAVVGEHGERLMGTYAVISPGLVRIRTPQGGS
jgi:predicted nuclease of predicted toxin-antitoxin system